MRPPRGGASGCSDADSSSPAACWAPGLWRAGAAPCHRVQRRAEKRQRKGRKEHAGEEVGGGVGTRPPGERCGGWGGRDSNGRESAQHSTTQAEGRSDESSARKGAPVHDRWRVRNNCRGAARGRAAGQLSRETSMVPWAVLGGHARWRDTPSWSHDHMGPSANCQC